METCEWVICLALLVAAMYVYVVKFSPEGYEDAEGYHSGRESEQPEGVSGVNEEGD